MRIPVWLVVGISLLIIIAVAAPSLWDSLLDLADSIFEWDR